MKMNHTSPKSDYEIRLLKYSKADEKYADHHDVGDRRTQLLDVVLCCSPNVTSASFATIFRSVYIPRSTFQKRGHKFANSFGWLIKTRRYLRRGLRFSDSLNSRYIA